MIESADNLTQLFICIRTLLRFPLLAPEIWGGVLGQLYWVATLCIIVLFQNNSKFNLELTVFNFRPTPHFMCYVLVKK